MNGEKRINCMKCKYYYITWDVSNPRGCRYFGFKTRLIPSLVVFKSSGKRCEAYRTKD